MTVVAALESPAVVAGLDEVTVMGQPVEQGHWNYTTRLNIALLLLAALLVWRFLRTGGPEMLRMMNKPAERRAG